MHLRSDSCLNWWDDFSVHSCLSEKTRVPYALEGVVKKHDVDTLRSHLMVSTMQSRGVLEEQWLSSGGGISFSWSNWVSGYFKRGMQEKNWQNCKKKAGEVGVGSGWTKNQGYSWANKKGTWEASLLGRGLTIKVPAGPRKGLGFCSKGNVQRRHALN